MKSHTTDGLCYPRARCGWNGSGNEKDSEDLSEDLADKNASRIEQWKVEEEAGVPAPGRKHLP